MTQERFRYRKGGSGTQIIYINIPLKVAGFNAFQAIRLGHCFHWAKAFKKRQNASVKKRRRERDRESERETDRQTETETETEGER